MASPWRTTIASAHRKSFRMRGKISAGRTGLEGRQCHIARGVLRASVHRSEGARYPCRPQKSGDHKWANTSLLGCSAYRRACSRLFTCWRIFEREAPATASRRFVSPAPIARNPFRAIVFRQDANGSGLSRHRLFANRIHFARHRDAGRRRLRNLGRTGCRGTTMTRLAALAADRRHVRAVRADGFPALATCFARLFRREFVSRALLMGSASAQARDASLLLLVH